MGLSDLLEDNYSDSHESALMELAQKRRQRPFQRVSIHQSQKIGYLFANVRYYTVIKDNSMLSDLPPWYMVLGPGTITALRTTRALLRINIPMEMDFTAIYRLMRTICSEVTFDEVIDAMVIFFGPPKQNFEEFLLGFAIRQETKVSEDKYSARECIFYSAITFFTIERFERHLKTPLPPLIFRQIAPVLYWILNQSVINSVDVVRAFTRLLLAAKSPYVRPLPNSLVSFIKLDQATRKFDWCDCKKNVIKYDYLHTKNAHKDYIWLEEDAPYLPLPNYIENQRSFRKILLRAKERWHIPFSYPTSSLFKKKGKSIDLSNTAEYSKLVQKAKRIYEHKLNRDFEQCARAFWNKYYRGNVPSGCEGRQFEVFKSYHRTQLCPKKQPKIRDVYTATPFRGMPYEYGEAFENTHICQHWGCHPYSDCASSSADTQFTFGDGTSSNLQYSIPDTSTNNDEEDKDNINDENKDDINDENKDDINDENKDDIEDNDNVDNDNVDKANDNNNDDKTNDDDKNVNDTDNNSDNKENVNANDNINESLNTNDNIKDNESVKANDNVDDKKNDEEA